jgi:hypothetical protein
MTCFTCQYFLDYRLVLLGVKDVKPALYKHTDVLIQNTTPDKISKSVKNTNWFNVAP